MGYGEHMRAWRRHAGARTHGIALVALAVLLVSCAAPQQARGASPSCDQSCLAERLRAAGAWVSGGDSLPAAGALWSNASGYVYMVNGERVTVYVFADTSAANTAALEVQDGGSQIVHQGLFGGSMATIDWVAPPHFFKLGRLIALYVGSAQGTLLPIHQVMGSPFAEEHPF
jgi:hypothetical protein